MGGIGITAQVQFYFPAVFLQQALGKPAHRYRFTRADVDNSMVNPPKRQGYDGPRHLSYREIIAQLLTTGHAEGAISAPYGAPQLGIERTLMLVLPVGVENPRPGKGERGAGLQEFYLAPKCIFRKTVGIVRLDWHLLMQRPVLPTVLKAGPADQQGSKAGLDDGLQEGILAGKFQLVMMLRLVVRQTVPGKVQHEIWTSQLKKGIFAWHGNIHLQHPDTGG